MGPILNAREAPYRFIVKLKIVGRGGQTSVGTGFLETGNRVVTAAHNLYHSSRLGGLARKIDISFVDTTGAGNHELQVASSNLRVHENWKITHKKKYDIGIIHLGRSAPPVSGGFQLATYRPQDLRNTAAHVSGYEETSDLVQTGKSIIISQAGNGTFRYSAETRYGHSGSPIWLQDAEHGPFKAVGVHTAKPFSGGGTATHFRNPFLQTLLAL